MKKTAVAMMVASVLMVSAVEKIQAGNAEKGKASYATCIACHGDKGQGNAALKAPALAGQGDWYIAGQLKKFKDGLRGTDPKDAQGMMMAPMAKMLASDEAVADVAAYVATFAPVAAPSTIKGDAAAGKAKYVTCVACHGDKAQGNVAMKAPALSHLPDWYVVSSLTKFKEGIRGSNPKDVQGAMMAPMAKMLSDADMNNVAAYISTLK